MYCCNAHSTHCCHSCQLRSLQLLRELSASETLSAVSGADTTPPAATAIVTVKMANANLVAAPVATCVIAERATLQPGFSLTLCWPYCFHHKSLALALCCGCFHFFQVYGLEGVPDLAEPHRHLSAAVQFRRSPVYDQAVPQCCRRGGSQLGFFLPDLQATRTRATRSPTGH